MFFRNYKYSLIRSIRQKELLFWSILFPIILGTLFKVSFGDITDNEVTFHQIPVAYVEGEMPQKEFELLLKELETENELIEVTVMKKAEAEKCLNAGEVAGIFENDKEITLIVTEEEINTSILKQIQEQYEQVVRAFSNIGAKHPEKIEEVANSVDEQWEYVKEENITNKEMDMFMDYFYALIAMQCLYSCFSGLLCAIEFKANLSQLAARRVAASTSRFMILLAEITAKITVQFACSVIGAVYLRYALDITLGADSGRILLVMLLGNVVGVMNGVFIGSIGKVKQTIKEGICISVTLFSSFLAGLMRNGMYQILEENAPIVNRINPASLILKAFYSLNIYENHTKYNGCILTLSLITIILCAGSYLLVRRERYASI